MASRCRQPGPWLLASTTGDECGDVRDRATDIGVQSLDLHTLGRGEQSVNCYAKKRVTHVIAL